MTAVARRFDRDNVLYRLDDGTGRHALVTEIFASFEAFLATALAEREEPVE